MPNLKKIQELRQEAEKILSQKDAFIRHDRINEDIARLLEELSVQQIELEMQNDELQRSQEELENEKNKFIDLYEHAPVAYITISATGNVISRNRKATEIFRHSGNLDYKYISIFPFIAQSSKTDFRKMLKNAFMLQEEQHGEIRMLNPAKETLHTEMHMTVFYSTERELDLCRITITNIESVKEKFDRELARSEEKYRELAENISEGIYLTENGYIKMVNTPACRLLGYEHHELIDRSVWEFVRPEQQNGLRKLFIKKVKEMDGSPVDIECVRKDGTTFWGEISMRIIRDQKRVFGVISDITARKKAEEALRESEQRLHMALSGTKAGLWDWNIETGEIIIDDRWAGMIGYKKEEVSPRIEFWKSLIHPDDFEKVQSKLTDHLEGKTEFYQTIYRMKAVDNSWRYIFDSGMVTKWDRNGKPLRAVGTHQDVTRQKQTEEKLREINATKDKLFSIIAHDLKSPYNAQLGFLELLLEDNKSFSDEQRKKFIKTVYHSTKQSFALLDNLLVWSRTQTDKIPFNPVELLLAQVFEEAVELQRYAAQAKNIMIDTQLDNESMEVTADQEMVNTVLRNLISNAIKFTPENGRIILGARTANDKKTLIYVKDTGVGIPEQDIGKLFDPASNYSRVGTNREKGTGIGLILCQDFVERNGGKIWVESPPEQGSTFFFTLESFKPTKKCDANCIQNFAKVMSKVKSNAELHQYFLKIIIPFFRHTYQKFSDEEINCFISELRTLAKKHNVKEFSIFSDTIVSSLRSKDKNQINICFAEFEKLTDEIEIAMQVGRNTIK